MRVPFVLVVTLGSIAPAQMSWVEVPNSTGGIYGWPAYDIARNRLVSVVDGVILAEWDGAAWTPGNAFGGIGRVTGVAYDAARQRTVINSTLAPYQQWFTMEWDGASWSYFNLPGDWPKSEVCYDPVRGRCVGLATIAGQTRLVGWTGSYWAAEAVPAATFGAFGHLVFDHARGRLLVMPNTGGWGSTALWGLANGTWTPLPSPPTTVARPVYDHLRQDLLTFDLTHALRFATGWTLESNAGWFASLGGSIWALDSRFCCTPSGTLLSTKSAYGGLLEGLRYPQAPISSITPYGQGCPGPLGVPTLTATAQPALGASVGIQMSGIPPYGLAYPYMFAGFNNQTSMGQSLPLNMAQFGMPGCQLLTSSDFITLSWSAGFNVPAIASFAGLHLYFQGMALNLLGPNGPNASFTAALDCRIGLPN